MFSNTLPHPADPLDYTLPQRTRPQPAASASLRAGSRRAPAVPAPLPVAPALRAAVRSNPAGEALYAQLAPLVRRLIRQYGKTPEMRQDMTGELYCRFYALMEAYDPARGVPLRPYLIRQLSATAYAYARQQWRLEKRLFALDAELERVCAATAHDPTDEWLRALSQEQMLAGLPTALAALPARQRQAVILRYYEDYSFEEMAQALDVQASTARSLLRHGLNKLRAALAPLASDADAA